MQDWQGHHLMVRFDWCGIDTLTPFPQCDATLAGCCLNHLRAERTIFGLLVHQYKS